MAVLVSYPVSPVFFELSWGVLSTIGVFLVFASISLTLVTKPCVLNFIPLVISVACAVANGACYYAYYTNGPETGRVAASIFADIFWMIQEVGLSFYNYQILIHILTNRARIIYLLVFWGLFVATVGIRVTIAVGRAIQLAGNNTDSQTVVSRLHIGYFVAIALMETWSALFLIRLMAKAYSRAPHSTEGGGVFRYLMRSAELRLATLCFIGIARAVTYSLQETEQRATTVASQIDRFTYTLECLFPVIMLLDILSAKRYRPSSQPGTDVATIDRENSVTSPHAQWGSWSPPKSRVATP
ncbi:hypothetical protein BJX61DRAFT_283620 [Aspergillus egyptiacus]|nr:hypothetical protein BJX61DRAFT_283620 [Aspergillus egyptiacus]